MLSPGTLLCELCPRFLERDPPISWATLPLGAANARFSRLNQPETMAQGGGRSPGPRPLSDGGQRSALGVPTNPLKRQQAPHSSPVLKPFSAEHSRPRVWKRDGSGRSRGPWGAGGRTPPHRPFLPGSPRRPAGRASASRCKPPGLAADLAASEGGKRANPGRSQGPNPARTPPGGVQRAPKRARAPDVTAKASDQSARRRRRHA